jgi:hypothetical protein
MRFVYRFDFSAIGSRREPNKKNPRQPCQRGFPNNFRNGLGKTLA